MHEARIYHEVFQPFPGNTDDTFAINEERGELLLKKPLNYENKQLYSLTIQAANLAATPSLSATARVTVNVLDVNDNRPTFDSDPEIRFIRENVGVNAPVSSSSLVDGRCSL